jgi:hypothetical protein
VQARCRWPARRIGADLRDQAVVGIVRDALDITTPLLRVMVYRSV